VCFVFVVWVLLLFHCSPLVHNTAEPSNPFLRCPIVTARQKKVLGSRAQRKACGGVGSRGLVVLVVVRKQTPYDHTKTESSSIRFTFSTGREGGERFPATTILYKTGGKKHVLSS
jgi:hypothetical protein